jgi:hypothetical protein
MKITKSALKQIIKEELNKIVSEEQESGQEFKLGDKVMVKGYSKPGIIIALPVAGADLPMLRNGFLVQLARGNKARFAASELTKV